MDILTIDIPRQLEILRKISEPVETFNAELKEYIDDMFEKMDAADGIGLAAPQVGRTNRFFVINIGNDFKKAFFNPEIIETSQDMSSYEEGCLSIPGSYQKVIRPAKIRIQAWNERGRPFTMEADGLLSTVIQHELDHLNGVLFIDRVSDRKKDKILKKFNVKES